MNVFDWLKILLSCTYRWAYFIRNIEPILYATTGKHFRKSCRKFDFWWILVCLFIFCWGFSNLFTHQITCSRCRIPSSRIFQIHGICQRILPHFAFMSFISSHFYRIEYTGNGSKLEIRKFEKFRKTRFPKIRLFKKSSGQFSKYRFPHSWFPQDQFLKVEFLKSRFFKKSIFICAIFKSSVFKNRFSKVEFQKC